MGANRLIGIGFAGWQKMEGFYPPRTRVSEMLSVYAEQFDVVEVRSTFQGIPSVARVSEWAESVPGGFRFHVIAFGGLTLHQLRPGQSESLSKSWVDVAVSPPDDIFSEFINAMAPLIDSNKLGSVILQFPPWFESSMESIAYLARCRDLMRGVPLGVELRNNSWFTPSSRLDHTLDRLIDYEMGIVVADLVIGDGSTLDVPKEITSEIGLIRLHGRLTEDWKRIGSNAAVTAHYEYREDELWELAGIIGSLGEYAEKVDVLFGVDASENAISVANRLIEIVDAEAFSEGLK
tara:strand:- start:850 stop:1725 length:876 start_codon:yes stop_codon:yes gene_type:complete